MRGPSNLKRKPGARSRRALAGALAILLFSAGPARGGIPDDAPFYKGWTVADIRVEGSPPEWEGGLRRGLALAPVPGVLRTRRALFYPSILEEDLDRVRLFLARRGYPAATVAARIEPEPSKRSLTVRLVVEPGAPSRVSVFRVAGAVPALAPEVARLRKEWEGGVFREDLLAETVDGLAAVHRDSGYAWVAVTPEVAAEPEGGVDLTLRVEPGPLCFFRKTVVEGAPDDLVSLVQKTADIEPGSRFNPSALEHARSNLRLLELFRQIRVEPEGGGDGAVDVNARLLMRTPRSIEFGIGYWTDDLLRGQARWEHRNLFSRGRGLRLQGAVSRFRQSVGISTWRPAWIGPRVRGELGGNLEWEREESYNLDSRSIELGARYRPSFNATLRAGVAFTDVNVDVKTEDVEAFREKDALLTTLSLLGHRDSSDDRLFPSSGSVAWARAEWAPPGFLSESHFVLGEASGTVYLGLTERIVWAARWTGGAAKPTGGSVDLLPNKRFFAGGASSMRGFERRRLGPRDNEGAPLGGEAKIEAAAELRFPLVWRVRAAAFTDAGQVWSRAREIRPDQLEVAVGPSLMILTPVGAVRVDWGHRITDREKGEPSDVYHLSIGHPF
ncbi:MAG: BamA/TamA family outer membrane protein [Candidatus Eisenbacteria bacterium]